MTISRAINIATAIIVAIVLTLAYLALSSIHAFAQQTAFSIKSPTTQWWPSDVQQVEVRIRGRLTTDPTTTHKILGRVTLKGSAIDWISMMALRATFLVPATQTWEVKSVSIFMTPQVVTGLASIEIITATMTATHIAPAGKTLALDMSMKTGVVVLGPVEMLPQPPPVVNPPASSLTLRVMRNDTKAALVTLTDGMTLDLSTLPAVSLLGLDAQPSMSVQKIDFSLDGQAINTEFSPPYMACNDWSACPQVFAVGARVLTLMPYDTAGKALSPVVVRYTVK